MKKVLKRVISCLSIAALSVSVLNSVVNASGRQFSTIILDNYTLLDDKGNFSDMTSLKSAEQYRLYKGTTANTNNSYVFFAHPDYSRFGFTVNDKLNYEEISNNIDNIIKEYYPNNTESDSTAPKIEINSYEDTTVYTIGYTDDKALMENKDNIAAIRKELEAENLITYFYEAGDIYLAEFSESFDNFSYKSISNEQMQSDKEVVSEYIEKNEIDCSVVLNGVNTFAVVPSADMTFNEYFNIVIDICEELNISPSIATIETGYRTMFDIHIGDANSDSKLNVRDCAFIASALAQGRNDELKDNADFNGDGNVNVRDAAAIAKNLSEK